MSVKIASIAKDIPPPLHVEEENAQAFGVEQPVSAVKSKRRREDEAEEQREDAIRRKFAWVGPGVDRDDTSTHADSRLLRLT